MVAISNTTLRANLYETIYDELTAANLLSSTVTVTAAYIDNDSAFPQVCINPANVSHSEFSLNRANSRKDIQVVIEVWTKKNKQIDQITDEIDATVRPLNIAGVTLIDWEEDNALNTSNDNKIHMKTITLVYLRG